MANQNKNEEKYPAGTKIELIRMMDDPFPVAPGTFGVVRFVDGIGNVHVEWETGSRLALIPEIDEFKVV